ncbi:hypothetical protein MUP01_02210 [Candidatus Bathyarchaeota archaeon]|nr:hypothetical protein [Candidatus Bathyarchaeota archaeon]
MPESAVVEADSTTAADTIPEPSIPATAEPVEEQAAPEATDVAEVAKDAADQPKKESEEETEAQQAVAHIWKGKMKDDPATKPKPKEAEAKAAEDVPEGAAKEPKKPKESDVTEAPEPSEDEVLADPLVGLSAPERSAMKAKTRRRIETLAHRMKEQLPLFNLGYAVDSALQAALDRKPIQAEFVQPLQNICAGLMDALGVSIPPPSPSVTKEQVDEMKKLAAKALDSMEEDDAKALQTAIDRLAAVPEAAPQPKPEPDPLPPQRPTPDRPVDRGPSAAEVKAEKALAQASWNRLDRDLRAGGVKDTVAFVRDVAIPKVAQLGVDPATFVQLPFETRSRLVLSVLADQKAVVRPPSPVAPKPVSTVGSRVVLPKPDGKDPAKTAVFAVWGNHSK